MAKVKTTGELVSVGCKTPNGIFMRLQIETTEQTPVMGGGYKDTKVWRPDPSGEVYTINGYRTPHGEAPRCLILNGYAITPDLPKDFVDKWFAQNQRLDLVKNRLIIVQSTEASLKAESAELRGEKNGMEPITPNNDPRIPRRKMLVNGRMVDEVTITDDKAA